jgi:type I restriction enzyme S subunit
MSHDVQEQAADYKLSKLQNVIANASNARGNLIDSLPNWLNAQTRKSAGRGRSADNTQQYGVQKLRELILELAVRGKLVEQDPNDEPASVLLEKIAEEKARLVREGKVKKQKKLPEISSDEKSFPLPLGWHWARIQDISSYIQRGKGPKYSEVGRVRVISQKCVQNSGFDISPARFVEDTSLDKYQPERFLVSNDLLWNSTGTGTVGRINVLESIEANTLVADSHVTVIRPLLVSSQFICSFISAPGVQLRIAPDHENSLVSGSTKQVELNTSQVTSVVVPVPPLAEQNRIVKKVDELMALCDQLEQQQADAVQAHDTLVKVLLDTLNQSDNADDFQQNWRRIAEHFDTLFTTESSIDQLKQTILQLAVMGKLVPQDPNDEPASVLLEKIAEEKARLVKEGKIKKQKPLPEISEDDKPFELPKNWEWTRFGSVFDVTSSKRINVKDYVSSGVPFFRSKEIGELKFGRTISTDIFISKDKYDELKNLSGFPNAGDLMLTAVGSIGNGWICDGRDFYYKDGNIAKIGCHQFADMCYTLDFIEAPLFNKQAMNTVSGTAYNALTLIKLNHLLFPTPPLAEQHRIVKKVDELMALCDQLKDHLNQAQTLQQQLADAVVAQSVE